MTAVTDTEKQAIRREVAEECATLAMMVSINYDKAGNKALANGAEGVHNAIVMAYDL